MSYIDYKQKYLKYKTKYTNLTNSHTRIQRGGAEPKPPVEEELPDGRQWNSDADHAGKAIYDKYYRVLEKQIKTLNDQVDKLEADKQSEKITSRRQAIEAERNAKKRKATRKEDALQKLLVDRDNHNDEWHESDMGTKAQAGIDRFIQDSSPAAAAARAQKKQQKRAGRAAGRTGRTGRTVEPKSQQRTPARKGTGLEEGFEDAANILAMDDESDDTDREGLVDVEALQEVLEDETGGDTGVKQKATGKAKWAQQMEAQAQHERAAFAAKRKPGLDLEPSPQTRRDSKSEAQLTVLTERAAKAEKVASDLKALNTGISDFEAHAFGNTNTLIEVLGGATTKLRAGIEFDETPGSVAHVIKALTNVEKTEADRDHNAKGKQLKDVHGNDNKNIGWAIGKDNSNIANIQKLFGRIADIIANIKTVKMYHELPRTEAFKDVTQDDVAQYPLRLYEIEDNSKPTEDTPYGPEGDTIKQIIQAFAEYNEAILQKGEVMKAVQANGEEH